MQEEIRKIKISVRELAEFCLKSGDLSSGFADSGRMMEGILAHKEIQSAAGSAYSAEVAVSHVVEMPGVIFEINGRIDGLIIMDGIVTVDEIKTMAAGFDNVDENSNPEYWGQAKCYAFIYGVQNNLSEIDVRLTYYCQKSKRIKYYNQFCKISELEEFVKTLLGIYHERLLIIEEWRKIRNIYLRELKFPFENYRAGQRDMAVAVYKSIKDGKFLFAEAPTGTGKTMAALFPALKAMGEGLTAKIFYITAKNITRTIAENTIELIRKKGLKVKSITLTAKEKICPFPEFECTPLECEYARGYYDRRNGAIEEIFRSEDFINAEKILRYSEKYKVCPFELSLDFSLLCDIIICDYNYVYDPRVYLRRFFEEPAEKYSVLVDEAHNLADRAREMYSAVLCDEKFLANRRSLRKSAPGLYRKIGKIINIFKESKNSVLSEADFKNIDEPPLELIAAVRSFTDSAREWLGDDKKDEAVSEPLLDLFFECLTFLRIAELYGNEHTTCYSRENEKNISVKLFCMDPARLLSETSKKSAAVIFFSATLSPVDYYVKILGGANDSAKIKLKSPFPAENLCVMANLSVQTRYSMREGSYRQVAGTINELIKSKNANFMVFFPSYAYMNNVIDSAPEIFEKMNILIQKSGMTEKEKEEFLSNFDDVNSNTIGFAVMGGAFGEGIDLTGEKLSGAVIVGVGLPQLSNERNLIMKFYDKKNLAGFNFAYIFPGLNKVMQAAGRVIRTDKDRGIICLIDSRFGESRYYNHLPAYWKPFKIINENSTALQIACEFWNDF